MGLWSLMIGHQRTVGQGKGGQRWVVRDWRVGQMWIGIMVGAWGWQRFVVGARGRAMG